MARGDLENSARLALRKGGVLLTSAFGLSFIVNVLRLSGPLFMILIYDRVLTSRSEETLFALLFMVAVLMISLGLLDYARKRIIARFAAQFQENLEDTILGAASQTEMLPAGKSKPATGLDEADSLRSFFHSGGLLAVMDFIWVPMFVTVVFLLHPMLGYICLGGIAAMFLVTGIRIAFMGGREERANISSKRIGELKNMVAASRSTVRSQDMIPGFKTRWMDARAAGRDDAIALRDWTSWFDHVSSTLVLLVRYGVLAAGAYLALQGKLTIGAMVASMFLVTRVLIPVNRFSCEIPAIVKAFSSWSRLKKILRGWDTASVEAETTPIGNVRERLSVSGLSARSAVTGNMLLRAVNLTVAPGEMVEIIGGSGAGKSVLAETLMGIRKKTNGTILYDGRNIARLNDQELARAFGYVPEVPAFVVGTLAENISHLDPNASMDAIVAAAKKACLHGWISALPDGYDTRIDVLGSEFSRGQRQQFALARALYRDPAILIMDEPDAVLLEKLPKTMKKTFDGILNRGGAIILLGRKPAKVQQARTRYALDKQTLGAPKQIAAAASRGKPPAKEPPEKSDPGKVTVLQDKKAETDAKKALVGGHS